MSPHQTGGDAGHPDDAGTAEQQILQVTGLPEVVIKAQRQHVIIDDRGFVDRHTVPPQIHHELPEPLHIGVPVHRPTPVFSASSDSVVAPDEGGQGDRRSGTAGQ
ncbi:hypothetical protein [Kineosporia sp. NBRC 101731]|uniref:hypothetical protein n=1 Tax=Kineosporia sp. NBRC 101731 TaxID=3032199 RepID=UPI002556FBA3|nr:hypothetical protein [Kineosporia sp. NBRC 101731]